jgi:predicted metal-binding protein
MNHQDVVLVCTLCGSTSQMRSQGYKSGGERLLEQLQSAVLPEAISVCPVRCMAVCQNGCAIAFMGHGKRTYLFGNLPVEPDDLESTVADVLMYAHQYHCNAEGIVAYGDRPELLRSRTLVVLPSLPS